MKYTQFSEGRTYENQVIVTISLLATTRVFLSVVQDLVSPLVRPAEIAIDTSMFVLFAGLFLLAFFRKTISKLPPVLGLLLIMLFAFNFMQFGGVMGSTRFTYYGGLFFIGMAFSNRNLYWMIGVQCLLLFLMLQLQSMGHPLIQLIYVRDAGGNTDFLFAMFGIAVMAAFFRETTKQEYLKMSKVSWELAQHVKVARDQNTKLIGQSETLTRAQAQLETEVQQRTAKLQVQNSAIEQFIKFNTRALHEPQAKLLEVVRTFEGDTTLHQLMHVSCNELNEVLTTIRKTILADENLNRGKIKLP